MRGPVESLKTSQSLMLDVVRVSAAAMVAIGHISQPYFSDVWPNVTFLAKAAVAIFFVLSGFVIRYVTSRRPGTFENYLKDRASRIYSVVIPALLFTLVADLIARQVNPAFFTNWSQDFVHPGVRMLENLFFTAQLWNRNVKPLSNSPFWSLNYEVFYYVLYGCAFYLAGAKRWLAFAIAAVIAGPKIMMLFPLWLIGAFTHDLYQKWIVSGRKIPEAIWAAGAATTLAIGIWAQQHADRGIMYKLSMYGYGLFGCIALLRLLLLLRTVEANPDSRSARATRFIAEGTFPIYLFHFPVYVLIAACIPYNHASSLEKILIFTATMTFGILAGHPCNLLKKKMRELTERRSRAQPAVYEVQTRQSRAS